MTQPTISAERIEEMLPCPFCGSALSIRGGVNGYGRCDTGGCWVNERAIVVPMDDPTQVAAWNRRSALRAQAQGSEVVPVGYATAHSLAQLAIPMTSNVDVRIYRKDHFLNKTDWPADLLPLYASPPVQAQPQATPGVGKLLWDCERIAGDMLTRNREDAETIRALIDVVKPLHFSALATPLAPVATPTHRHVKRGTEYVLIGIGKMQSDYWTDGHGHVDMTEVAIYRSINDGSLWARPREEFEDGRFEPLTAGRAAVAQDETP